MRERAVKCRYRRSCSESEALSVSGSDSEIEKLSEFREKESEDTRTKKREEVIENLDWVGWVATVNFFNCFNIFLGFQIKNF